MIEPNRTVTEEPVNPSNPSLGPDPLAFENNVIPCSSNAQISDPRSIALPIMACLLLRLRAGTICSCGYPLIAIPRIPLTEDPIDAGPSDTQPDRDFRGPDARVLQADDSR